MRHRFTALVLLAFCGVVTAQEPQAPHAGEGVQVVIDDDGGRAFIITSKFKSLGELHRMPGAVIAEPQQYNIFLGSDWATPQLRGRQAKLDNLLSSIRNQSELEKLGRYGIRNFFCAGYSQEVLTDFGEQEKLSDIRARAVIAELVNSGLLPKAAPSTIYMIFLEPGLRSTLGTLTGRKHYLAYHNFLNIAGQRLHYVVVPYEPVLNTAKALALRAFVVAALNPSGEVGN